MGSGASSSSSHDREKFPDVPANCASLAEANPARFVVEWREAAEAQIYTATFLPATGAVKGAVVMVLGLCDHMHNTDYHNSDGTHHLQPLFLDHGWAVVTYDTRGHGRTGLANGDLGVVTVDEKVTDDVAAAVMSAQAKFPAVPIVLAGHSMGGGHVITLFSEERAEAAAALSGVILFAPLCQQFPEIVLRSASVIGRLAPKLRVSDMGAGDMENKDLTKDVADLGLTKAEAEALLRSYNGDGDGFLSRDELEKALNGKELNLGLSPEDLDATVQKLDSSGDGRVSIDELTTAATIPKDALSMRFNEIATVGFFTSMANYLVPRVAKEHAPKITLPVLLIHGEEDAINPSAAAKEFVEATGGKQTIHIVPGMRHAPFADSDAATHLYPNVSAWLGALLGD